MIYIIDHSIQVTLSCDICDHVWSQSLSLDSLSEAEIEVDNNCECPCCKLATEEAGL